MKQSAQSITQSSAQPTAQSGVQLDAVMKKHNKRLNQYEQTNSQIEHRDEQLNTATLEMLDYEMRTFVLPLLESMQDELFERRYSSEIVLDKVSKEEDDQFYVIGSTFYMASQATPDTGRVSTEQRSLNSMRFYRVGDSVNIACEFSTQTVKSKVFELYFDDDSGAWYKDDSHELTAELQGSIDGVSHNHSVQSDHPQSGDSAESHSQGHVCPHCHHCHPELPCPPVFRGAELKFVLMDFVELVLLSDRSGLGGL
jgi:hypothetical protein